jgi:hypothetical protein
MGKKRVSISVSLRQEGSGSADIRAEGVMGRSGVGRFSCLAWHAGGYFAAGVSVERLRPDGVLGEMGSPKILPLRAELQVESPEALVGSPAWCLAEAAEILGQEDGRKRSRPLERKSGGGWMNPASAKGAPGGIPLSAKGVVGGILPSAKGVV